MGFFKLAGMTFSNIFTKKTTTKYPYEEYKPINGVRGEVKHINADLCNLCSMCKKKCPAGAISVDRSNKTWSINHFSCVQCASCVKACPKKCLEINSNLPHIGAQKNIDITKIPLEDKKNNDKIKQQSNK